MISLSDIRQYFEGICGADNSLKKCFILTEEGDIKDYEGDIGEAEMPFLMVIVPSADSKNSTQDNVTEDNSFLLYVLRKEDKSEFTTLEIQEALQPIMEQLKKNIIGQKETCHWLTGLDVSSFHTDPERKMFSKFTGWSVSFIINE